MPLPLRPIIGLDNFIAPVDDQITPPTYEEYLMKEPLFDSDDDPEMSEILDILMVADDAPSIISRRSQVLAKLLQLYREQVDPAATKIFWAKVSVINYPIEAEKIRSSRWSLEDLERLEAGLSQIRFKKLRKSYEAPEPDSLATQLRRNRINAINRNLLEIYCKQIKVFAKKVFWRNVEARNFPSELLKKKPNCWIDLDLDILESCLPKIWFERIEKIS